MENLDSVEIVEAVVVTPVVDKPVLAALECTRDSDCKVVDCENCS